MVPFSFPLALSDELLFRFSGGLKSFFLFALTRVLFLAVLSTGVLTVNREDAFLLMLVPLLLLFWIGLWLATTFVRRQTGDALAAAVFAAVVQSWVFAATFVVTG
jgi:hypothetical protein